MRDAGTGLPAQIDGTLFTPFVTTKAHGLGIGLTITRTIVDAHGGTIDARNNPEGGATFTVTLHRCAVWKRPRQGSAARPVAVARNRLVRTESMLSKRPRVLIADDHPGMVKAVCRLLALDCDVVGTVADGSALLEAAQRLQPDVIVLDVNLPNVHGLEACRQISDRYPETKVIVFTADERSGHHGTSLRGRRIGLCVKNGTSELLSAIKRLCVDDAGQTAR